MYISIREYASKWSVSQDTVRRLLRKGCLPYYKIGKNIRIPADAVPGEAKVEYKPSDHAGIKARLKSLTKGGVDDENLNQDYCAGFAGV